LEVAWNILTLTDEEEGEVLEFDEEVPIESKRRLHYVWLVNSSPRTTLTLKP